MFIPPSAFGNTPSPQWLQPAFGAGSPTRGFRNAVLPEVDRAELSQGRGRSKDQDGAPGSSRVRDHRSRSPVVKSDNKKRRSRSPNFYRSPSLEVKEGLTESVSLNNIPEHPKDKIRRESDDPNSEISRNLASAKAEVINAFREHGSWQLRKPQPLKTALDRFAFEVNRCLSPKLDMEISELEASVQAVSPENQKARNGALISRKQLALTAKGAGRARHHGPIRARELMPGQEKVDQEFVEALRNQLAEDKIRFDLKRSYRDYGQFDKVYLRSLSGEEEFSAYLQSEENRKSWLQTRIQEHNRQIR